MPDNTPNDVNANIENILAHLTHQQNELDKLHNDYSTLTAEWLISSAKAEAINQRNEIEKKLNEKIESELKKTKKMAMGLWTSVATVIAILGYLGLQEFIKETIERDFTEKLEKQVLEVEEKRLRRSDELLKKSIKLYSESHNKLNQNKNHLVVLQTDFGSRSPYMGVLKGAIYSINPNARIDVITDEVPAFEFFDAAWILSKAVEFYPENTIFVSITGDAGKGAFPVILRNEKKGHTFIGYLNGVFDIVKPPEPDGFDNIYSVDMKELKREWGYRGRLPKSEQLKNLGPNEDIGFIAGSISMLPTPWEENYDKKNNFPWDIVLKETTYTTKLENINPIVIPTKSPDSILIEGTIMNVDRYGNANTNISKNYLDTLLAKKNLKLDDGTHIVAAGIATDEDFSENQDEVIELKKVKFSTDYKAVKEGNPLITLANGKLQLAINKGDLARSPMLYVGALEEQKDENSRLIKPNMKVRVMVKKIVTDHQITSVAVEDVVDIADDISKK